MCFRTRVDGNRIRVPRVPSTLAILSPSAPSVRSISPPALPATHPHEHTTTTTRGPRCTVRIDAHVPGGLANGRAVPVPLVRRVDPVRGDRIRGGYVIAVVVCVVVAGCGVLPSHPIIATSVANHRHYHYHCHLDVTTTTTATWTTYSTQAPPSTDGQKTLLLPRRPPRSHLHHRALQTPRGDLGWMNGSILPPSLLLLDCHPTLAQPIDI